MASKPNKAHSPQKLCVPHPTKARAVHPTRTPSALTHDTCLHHHSEAGAVAGLAGQEHLLPQHPLLVSRVLTRHAVAWIGGGKTTERWHWGGVRSVGAVGGGPTAALQPQRLLGVTLGVTPCPRMGQSGRSRAFGVVGCTQSGGGGEGGALPSGTAATVRTLRLGLGSGRAHTSFPNLCDGGSRKVISYLCRIFRKPTWRGTAALGTESPPHSPPPTPPSCREPREPSAPGVGTHWGHLQQQHTDPKGTGAELYGDRRGRPSARVMRGHPPCG